MELKKMRKFSNAASSSYDKITFYKNENDKKQQRETKDLVIPGILIKPKNSSFLLGKATNFQDINTQKQLLGLNLNDIFNNVKNNFKIKNTDAYNDDDNLVNKYIEVLIEALISQFISEKKLIQGQDLEKYQESFIEEFKRYFSSIREKIKNYPYYLPTIHPIFLNLIDYFDVKLYEARIKELGEQNNNKINSENKIKEFKSKLNSKDIELLNILIEEFKGDNDEVNEDETEDETEYEKKAVNQKK